MALLRELKRHVKNIKIFRAYSTFELAKQTALFPVDYYFRKGRSSYPLNVAFFVTLRCNARCTMCNLKDILNGGGQEEPTLDDIDRFLCSIKGVKPSIILFGGEPFVRKDIVDIVRVVKKRRFNCGMFTNGILLNKEIVESLTKLNLDFIVFSMQGVGDRHDRVVGIKGAYDKVLYNMGLFTKSSLYTKVIIHTTITGENLEDLVNLVYVAKDKRVDLMRFGHPTFFTSSDLEKNRRVCQSFFPEKDLSEMSYIYNPEGKGDKYYEAIKKLKEKFASDITFVPDLSLREVRSWYSDDFKTDRKCRFLWRGLFVYPNGDVYPCESLKYPIGNIYKDSFTKIWNNERYTKLRMVIKKGLLPACARCCKL